MHEWTGTISFFEVNRILFDDLELKHAEYGRDIGVG